MHVWRKKPCRKCSDDCRIRPVATPPPSELDRLKQTLADLRQDVFCLRERPEEVLDLKQRLSSTLLQDPLPVDPVLASSLETAFQRKSSGRREWLVMQIDECRRLQRGRESEQIMRAYGVLHVVTPVKFHGKTVFGLRSGPMKISPWSQQEQATLAKLCGISVSDLPAELLTGPVLTQHHIESVKQSQEQRAGLIECLIDSTAPAPSPASPVTTEPGLLDLLQPGFADHLDVLFRVVQMEAKQLEDGSPVESARSRLLQVTQRGRHLVDSIRDLTRVDNVPHHPVSLHDSLSQWCEQLQTQSPSLRIQQRFEAVDDQVWASPHSLNHLLFSIISGVADGLPEGTGMLGISTRNREHQGKPCIHLEIRDGGGLSTFAGVGRPLDQAILEEQNEENQAFADWVALAENLDADLQILREDGVVTRAELWIFPGEPDAAQADETGNVPSVWVVEDEDRDYETVRHMMTEAGVRPFRLQNAAELRNHYLHATEAPSLVMLKYLLPDERGAHLRTWLYEQDPELPVILSSSFTATHPGIATAVHLPGTMFLQKPYDRQSLLDMLRMTIDETLPGL